MNTENKAEAVTGARTVGRDDLELRVGVRIRLMRDVERYPFFIARKGALGTVTAYDKHDLAVKMDEKLESCEEWDNCILWNGNEGEHDSFEEFCDDVKMIEG